MKQVIRLLVFFAVVANVYADCCLSPQEPHDLLSQSAEKPIGALKILAPAVLHKSQTSFIWGTGAGISCRQACAPLMGSPTIFGLLGALCRRSFLI